jgi:TatA/E family protein of Tat protein translocase
MFNLGPLEVIAILVVALVVFGPNRLPEIGKQVGRAIREVKKFQSSIQDEVKDVFDVNSKPAQTGFPQQTAAERAAAESAANAFRGNSTAAATPADGATPTDGATPAPTDGETGAAAPAAATGEAAGDVPKPIPGQTDLFGGEAEPKDVPAGPDESSPR